ELQIRVWHHEAHFSVNFPPEVRIQADAHDEHPQQRAADAADELAAVPHCAFHFAEPDGVKTVQLGKDRVHRVCSPPRWPKAKVMSRPVAASSRSSRPVSDRNTDSSVGCSTWI